VILGRIREDPALARLMPETAIKVTGRPSFAGAEAQQPRGNGSLSRAQAGQRKSKNVGKISSSALI
jgi:hypothetical protein